MSATPPTKTHLSPFAQFVHSESFAGMLLIAVALLAFGWANSPWAESYMALQHVHFGLSAGHAELNLSLAHWVNDALMAVFFLLVGLEIKRELLMGELASRRRATLAVAAALGGMLLPAAIYALLNSGVLGGDRAGLGGWGIPMATDIAFALGILALLGKRVPTGLKIFLTALAIVDDLGAVVVIALFYTASLSLPYLLLAALTWGAALVLGKRGHSSLKLYTVLGLLLWFFVYKSGLHATIAGVLLALAIPLRKPDASLLNNLQLEQRPRHTDKLGSQLRDLEGLLERSQSPLHRLEHALHPVVTFAVLPLFALMNAGVAVSGSLGSVSLGVLAGLVLGKPLGVVGGAWLAVRSGLAALPAGVRWPHMLGAGLLAGIGFTMSLFVANLAFKEGSPLLTQAKLGVLLASVIAALLGLFWLWQLGRRQAIK